MICERMGSEEFHVEQVAEVQDSSALMFHVEPSKLVNQSVQ